MIQYKSYHPCYIEIFRWRPAHKLSWTCMPKQKAAKKHLYTAAFSLKLQAAFPGRQDWRTEFRGCRLIIRTVTREVLLQISCAHRCGCSTITSCLHLYIYRQTSQFGVHSDASPPTCCSDLYVDRRLLIR